MAVIIGNDGSIGTWFPGHGGSTTAGSLHTWRMRATNTTTEVTGFTGNANVRRNRGGLRSIEGSASGAVDNVGSPGMTAFVAAGEGIVLTAQSGNTWTFTALLSAMQFESNKRENTAPITFDFIGGDANDFAEAWA